MVKNDPKKVKKDPRKVKKDPKRVKKGEKGPYTVSNATPAKTT